jgi:hypothetical protein
MRIRFHCVCASAALSAVLACLPATAAEYCATRPPPEGLVARCQKLDIVAPRTKVDLEIVLAKWMQTCAQRKRGESLVFGNESVDRVWALIEGKRESPYSGIRILPRYAPLTFTSEGRTCYGIRSVHFVVAGTESVVEFDEPDITIPDSVDDHTDEQIEQAVRAAETALRQHPGADARERAKMQSVLQWMRQHGRDFNDVYYNVAPYSTFGDWNDPTCYKELRGGRYQCLPADAARQACAVHIGPRILSLHLDGASPQQMAEHLLSMARDIERGLQHLKQIQAQDTAGAVPCPSIETVFMPEVASMAEKANALYNAWDAGP